MNQTKKEYSVPAIEKAITILNTLAEKGDQTITDLHTLLHIPKSSTFVILNTLEKYNLIEKTDDGKFHLGHGLFQLGMKFYNQLDVRKIARPHVERLVDGTPFTCHLAVLINNKPVYIDKVEGNGFVRFATKIGQSLPLHLSGVGKALALGMTDDQIKEAVKETVEFTTDKSPRSIEEVLEDLRFARQNGYCVEDQQMESGIRCIGAPIYGPLGDIVAAISITGLVKDLTADRFHPLGIKVAQTAHDISKELGYKSGAQA